MTDQELIIKIALILSAQIGRTGIALATDMADANKVNDIINQTMDFIKALEK